MVNRWRIYKPGHRKKHNNTIVNSHDIVMTKIRNNNQGELDSGPDSAKNSSPSLKPTLELQLMSRDRERRKGWKTVRRPASVLVKCLRVTNWLTAIN